MSMIARKKLEEVINPQARILNSGFYIGNVFHKRFTPKIHKFNYPLYMAFLDLDEIEALHSQYWWFSSRRWAPLQLKSSDYFRSIALHASNKNTDKGDVLIKTDQSAIVGSQLKQTAISIAKILGADVGRVNRVCMLAQLRSFGVYFSPVNFFFLYEGRTAKYLVAEVSNTPWNKKHCYLVDITNPESTSKAFHVSPFFDFNMSYQWSIKPPNKKTFIRIENRNESLLFTAIFSAQRYEINAKTMRKIFFKWPVIAVVIVRRIYWQATKLIVKGIKLVPYQTK